MKNSSSSSSSNSKEEETKKDSSSPNLDWRFNQTLRNVQGLLKGRSFPGKVMLTRRSEPFLGPLSPISPSNAGRSHFESDLGPSKDVDDYERGLACASSQACELLGYAIFQLVAGKKHGEVQKSRNTTNNPNGDKLKMQTSKNESPPQDLPRSKSGARSTDTARLAKFTKELSGPTVILDKLRELAWSGVPPYMRPNVWRLLLGYAPPNSDRTEGVLKRKRLEYVECVSHYYDIPDTERSDDEINMLRQISVDCPRTVPDVSFFQQPKVQKSVERILYTWAIRHPASGYVQGINDLVTPFLIVFLSEHLEGDMENWSLEDLSPLTISNVEADCYWCLSKLLDGMQDHYTFAQPGIQRLVFKLKELVRRIDEPVSRHIEEQGLEFLQFAFRWFNCLLIREIPFHLVTRLWDTYLAEGDSLPEFLVYIFASFLLTWSDKLQKLDFQEMVMFLQHLPTKNWTDQELEMVLSRAYMWHTMFESSPSHLAS